MKLDKICRTCLLEKGSLKPLFGANLPNMIMSFTSVQIIEGDGLPNQICTQCLQTVNRAFSFKQQCEKSDGKIRDYINRTNANNVLHSSQEFIPDKDTNLFSTNDALQHSSIFNDIFNETHVSLVENFSADNTAVTDLAETMESLQTIAEQCLPATWEAEPSIDNIHNNNEEACDGFELLSFQKCQFCDELFKDDWSMGEHIKIHMCQDKYSVQDCYNDKSINNCVERKNEQGRNKEFNCSKCSLKFSEFKLFKQHQKENHIDEVKSYVCTTCGKRYRQNKLLIIHMRTHTGERPLSCEQCGKTFALPSSLHKHKLIHLGEKRHRCTICEKSFAQASNLNVHLRSHTGEKPYICNICGRGCMTSVNLSIHMRIHTGERPYKCTNCTAAFSTSSQLRKHNLLHTGERPYKCWYCGKAFRQKDTLDTHVRYHTGERPYACTICPKNYIAASHLRVHMRIHTNDKQHECHICMRRFNEAKTLKSHIFTHTGQKPYLCKNCGSSFSQSGSLSTHMKSCNLPNNKLN